MRFPETVQVLDGLRIVRKGSDRVMSKKDDLLTFIADMEAEKEMAKVYGEYWKIRDYIGRQSHIAGELCLIYEKIRKAEAKSNCRPGSIGARKARQKAKMARQKQKELEHIMKQTLNDYHPKEPSFIFAEKKADCERLCPVNTEPRQYKEHFDEGCSAE